MKNTAVIGILTISLLVFAACGGGDDEAILPAGSTAVLDTSNDTSATGTVASDTATATHPGSPGGTALVPDVDSGTTVLVVLEDGSIAVREQTIPPGPAILTVSNAGSDVHNLFIEGEGISRAAGDPIPEGQRADVDVMFKPGTYTLYCPIADHRQNGEQVTLTIRP